MKIMISCESFLKPMCDKLLEKLKNKRTVKHLACPICGGKRFAPGLLHRPVSYSSQKNDLGSNLLLPRSSFFWLECDICSYRMYFNAEKLDVNRKYT